MQTQQKESKRRIPVDPCRKCAGKPELSLGSHCMWHCEPSDLRQLSRKKLMELKEIRNVKRESMLLGFEKWAVET